MHTGTQSSRGHDKREALICEYLHFSMVPASLILSPHYRNSNAVCPTFFRHVQVYKFRVIYSEYHD